MPSKRCPRTLALSLRRYCGRIVVGHFAPEHLLGRLSRPGAETVFRVPRQIVEVEANGREGCCPREAQPPLDVLTSEAEHPRRYQDPQAEHEIEPFFPLGESCERCDRHNADDDPTHPGIGRRRVIGHKAEYPRRQKQERRKDEIENINT
jgi:hypothetical protein